MFTIIDKIRFAALLREAIYSIQHKLNIETLPQVRERIGDAIFEGEATISIWSRKTNPRVPNSIDPDRMERLVTFCVKNSRLDRPWARSILTAGVYRGSSTHETLEDFLDTLFPHAQTVRPRVVLCYQGDQTVDRQLAPQIISSLSAICEIWVEPSPHLTPSWETKLSESLLNAKYIIVLLSAAAVHGGELVKSLVQKADQLANNSGKSLAFLPVRVGYVQPFTGLFSQHFDPINWAYWGETADTPALLAAMREAISGRPLPLDNGAKADLVNKASSFDLKTLPPDPSRFVHRDGAVHFDSEFYIERAADHKTLRLIAQKGRTIVLKGPSQMGKSSLMVRLKSEAEAAGKKVIYMDFQDLPRVSLDGRTFFNEFFEWLLELCDAEVPEKRIGAIKSTRAITRHLNDHLLEKFNNGLVLMIDEADALFKFPFYADFFAMLRAWDNRRARSPIWQNLDLVLATSTEEYLDILDNFQSPFNVGTVVELEDFSLAQIEQLNAKYANPFDYIELAKLIDLLDGHPYLTRKAMFEVASGNYSAAELFDHVCDEKGPFGDHLRSIILYRIGSRPNLIAAMKSVIQAERLNDMQAFWHLRGAGLIKGPANQVVWRRKLYQQFFEQYLAVM